MVICDAGDVDTDFGLSAASNPTLGFVSASGPTAQKGVIYQDASYLNVAGLTHGLKLMYQDIGLDIVQGYDKISGNSVDIISSANVELTDTNGEQAWLYAEPRINQSGTAAYNGIHVNVLETTPGTSIGDGSTGQGNNLLLLERESTPLFAVNRLGEVSVGGVTPVAGTKLLLPLENDAATPTLAFGDGNTGFYESADNELAVAINGSKDWSFKGNTFESNTTGGPYLWSAAGNTTTPNIVFTGDTDTGFSRSAADSLSLIAGGVEAMRFTEATGVLQTVQTNAGLTADVGSAQGSGVITSSYNVYTTVANAGDCATLPATAPVGTIVVVKNDAAANAMDVFPASGDDLGQGADTALSLAAGKGAMFLCVVADSTWTNILEGI